MAQTRSRTSDSPPTTRWLVAFLLLAVLAVVLAVLIPDQNSVQQFYFRIIIAIAVAGLAAIIPGFLDIQLQWFKNALRAGGAIALFVFVYYVNPPTIENGQKGPPIPDFSGEWEYICTANNVKYQHGGIATFETRQGDYGIEIKINGQRQWVEDKRKGKPGTREKVDLNWHTSWGMVASHNTFKFEYSVERSENTITGYGWAVFQSKEGKPYLIKGNFYQHAPVDPLYGPMVFRKKDAT